VNPNFLQKQILSKRPARYQGLTTQEYHEMVLREKEDYEEWLSEKGNDALPQSVRLCLKSDSGRAQWLSVHNFAIDKLPMAIVQLKKMNDYLKTLGLKYPLELKDGLIDKLKRDREKQTLARQRQLEASSKRVGSKKLASSGFDKKIAAEMASWKESAFAGNWDSPEFEDGPGPLPDW